jgi:transcriptional regulator with XRE-family HTH domain
MERYDVEDPPASRLVDHVGARLRGCRVERGLSLSELARSAGIGKATLSRLEAGGQNATMETLYAVTTALGLPLSAVLPSPGRGAGAHGPTVLGHGVSAVLLDVVTAATATTETYRLTFAAGEVRRSAPHAAGVTEHLVVVEGIVHVGAVGASRRLAPGGHHTWLADTEHLYEAEGPGDAVAVLVVRHPAAATAAS